ncbi:MAG: hypothetical protein SCABRO_01385 [Candidatus Scalindua brodae]|uniref:Uncharacterized protein n=1 Tax=Candidatus Scalindua brodae TaxID=237368 RepID=A0A0B0ELX3_9BACT|nr:MAG: hypothetical protein SCABRO_01385 [Candidatus Scalindua brodae]
MVQESGIHDKEVERLKIKYGFFKFLLGTFAISVLSLAINWQIQEKRLQFEIQTKESDYIAQFLEHGLDKELENRRDFAAYFVRLSPSEEARGRWKGYLEFIEDLLKKAREAERIIAKKDAELRIAAEKVALAQQQAEVARAEIERLSLSNADNKNVDKLKSQLSQSSKEAEESRKQLQELQGAVAEKRQVLASIRSKPIDTELTIRFTPVILHKNQKAGAVIGIGLYLSKVQKMCWKKSNMLNIRYIRLLIILFGLLMNVATAHMHFLYPHQDGELSR